MTAQKSKKSRYLGWQETPIHQARFGQSTRGGSNNTKAKFKNSTGPVQEIENHKWFILDAKQLPVGRLASVAASILMGKHQTTYTPGAGSGDAVIVINAKDAFFTSNKAHKKIYYRHTGWVGGLKNETAGEALQKHPEKVIWDAVYGMMPKNRLSNKQLVHLKIYKDDKHGQGAQKPITLDLKGQSLLKSISKEKVA